MAGQRRNRSIIHEIVISPTGRNITMRGSTRKPLVSSSKNLIKPPLDAGSGAPFFLLLIGIGFGDLFKNLIFLVSSRKNGRYLILSVLQKILPMCHARTV